jgi:hypothetical protein
VTNERRRDPRDLQGAIYGTILVISLIAVASEYAATDLEIVGSVAATVLVFWLAHVYAGVVGQRLAAGRSVGWAGVRSEMRAEWPMVEAAILPLAAVALGALDILSEGDGVGIALAAGIVVLAGYGVAIARREKRGLLATIGIAAVNGAFGAVMVVLKVVVH